MNTNDKTATATTCVKLFRYKHYFTLDPPDFNPENSNHILLQIRLSNSSVCNIFTLWLSWSTSVDRVHADDISKRDPNILSMSASFCFICSFPLFWNKKKCILDLGSLLDISSACALWTEVDHESQTVKMLQTLEFERRWFRTRARIWWRKWNNSFVNRWSRRHIKELQMHPKPYYFSLD
jgi:hypothetical protein